MAGFWGGRLEKDHMARLRVEEEKAESGLYYNNPLAQPNYSPRKAIAVSSKGRCPRGPTDTPLDLSCTVFTSFLQIQTEDRSSNMNL